MSHEEIMISTPDGDCPAHVFTPDGAGPWPATILFMDVFAIRPALLAMASRLASGGYVVLLPDLFYRAGRYETIDAQAVLAMGSPREALAPLLRSTDKQRAGADTAAFIAYLDSRGDVAGGKIGVTGYCMGGVTALVAAALYPDRIAAAAAFHAGNLATDEPDSPHLLAPRIKARVLVAGAVEDASYPPAMADRLDQALTAAGVDHVCTFYDGAKHGWTMTDLPVHDEAAAERHWHDLFALFGETLGESAAIGDA